MNITLGIGVIAAPEFRLFTSVRVSARPLDRSWILASLPRLGNLGPDRRHRTPRFTHFEDKTLIERIPGRYEAELARGLVVADVVADQRPRHAELYV
jgi:hypothetical protein